MTSFSPLEESCRLISVLCVWGINSDRICLNHINNGVLCIASLHPRPLSMLAKMCTLLLSALLVTAGSLVGRAPPKVIESCVQPNTVAMTFDDGPYIYQTVVSDVLTKYNVTGTFFVNGDNYDCIYDSDVVDRLRYTFMAGHQIASHTWSHPNLKKLSANKITEEIVRLDTALLAILGIRTNFMRPPYGNYNTLVRQTAADQNKTLITWDWDSGDSVGESYQDSETDYDKIVAEHPTTLLALNHETEKNTAHYLVEYAVTKLLDAGYKLVTVAECLDLPLYASQGPFGTRDSTWQC
ncbi:carbohydrate esterase family 4 protein [Mycena belliarum]|uniref:Carbohydrate esterase family 4 protein n=1 Tax=Mycena belliarum TaxID=1033014 RepID=A0AAD6TNR2_9AGAR|nr:carbohydrate esterase family 4 protein [Mycena belliae]